MEKLSSTDLLGFSDQVISDLVPKEIVFTIDGKDYTADISVKRLSFDESVDLTRGKNLTDMLMADLHKVRVLQTIYNADTKEPFFPSLERVGKTSPIIVDAMHKASESVNDFSGKQQTKHLMKMNSGANSSAVESVEEQSKKQGET